MKAAIIIFPGSNCDEDTKIALKHLCKSEIYMVWHKDSCLPNVDLIILPGGFSYGDYLRPGALASKSRILSDVIHKQKTGVPILGICNGFQILTETNLLPGTLIRNLNLKFICKNVSLRTENNNSIFTSKFKRNEIIHMPIAHHDGSYYADEETIRNLEDKERIAFKYCNTDGNVSKKTNPNGSVNNIAGVFNEKKNVLGLMPHPERAYDSLTSRTDGSKIFLSVIEKILI